MSSKPAWVTDWDLVLPPPPLLTPPKFKRQPGVVHEFNLSTLGSKSQVDLCEFEASLAYSASSRTARTTQRNPVGKTNKQTNERTNKTSLGSWFSPPTMGSEDAALMATKIVCQSVFCQ